MKIFYVCYEDISGHNGAVRHIIEIVVNLQKLGHKIQLCVPGVARYKGEMPLDIKYIPIVNLPFLRPLSYILFALFFLVLYLLRFKPDVVYLREMLFGTTQQVIISRWLKYPSVVEVNGALAEQKKRLNIFSLLIKFMQRKSFNLVDKIIVHSSGLAWEIEKEYKIQSSRIVVIRMGVDIERFKPIPRQETRKRLKLADDFYYVGFTGSLLPWQGIDNLIDSAPLIIREIPRVRFLIVGGGRLRGSLVRRAVRAGCRDNFIFTGEVEFESVPLYINSFDIGVAFFKPVRSDPGDPIKLYEYLACGIPVVASNVKGYGDVVEGVGAGRGVDSLNPLAVSRIIIDLLRDEDLRSNMAQAAGPYSVKDSTWLVRARETEVYLRQIQHKDKE
ncbi:MAG: glycosyltransferase family 4 protein [Candidatus Omnitrophota bacterium]